MKIGILGGSFNPPHLGHLILAEEVKEHLGLCKVIFVPCNIPPHKRRIVLAPAFRRLEMLKLLLKDNPHFQVDSFEVERGGVSYTIQTIEYLRKKYKGSQLFLIIGSDLLNQFHTWRDYSRILKLVKVVVGSRGKKLPLKKGFIPVRIPCIEISSSDIRKRIREGRSTKYFLPDQLQEYIKKYKLYKN